MKCSNCGNELENGVVFCNNCGTPVTENASGSVESAEVVNEPVLTEKPNKKSKAPVIGVIAAVLIIAIGATCFAAGPFISNLFVSDSTRVENALKNTVKEMQPEGEPYGQAFQKFYMDSATTTKINVNYEGDEIGRFVYNRDPANDLAYGTIGSDYISATNDIGEIYGDGDYLYARLSLVDDEWFKLPKKDVLSKYNNSLLSDMIGKKAEFDEDFSFEPLTYEDIESLNIYADFYEEFAEKYNDDIMTLLTAVSESAEGIDDEYKLNNGGTAKGYKVSVKAADFENIVRDFGAYYAEALDYSAVFDKYAPLIKAFGGEEFDYNTLMGEITSAYTDTFNEMADELAKTEETAEVNLYVYKNKIVKISSQNEGSEFNLEFPDGDYESCTFNLNADGDIVNCDVMQDNGNITININVSEDGSDMAIVDLSYNKSSGDYSLDVKYDDGYDKANVSADGIYLITDSSFKFTLNNLDIDDGDDSDSIGIINAEMTVEALNENIADHSPADDVSYDIFTSDESEFEALQGKIMEIASLVSQYM